METKYDKKADAIYILFGDEQQAYTKELDNERLIDYDANNNPVGVELLCVSMGVITDDLPNRTEVERILDEKGIKIYA